MSFKKYRATDIIIFTIIYFVFEFIAHFAATSWFPEQVFSVSLLLPITLIIIMRWDYYAIIDIILFPIFFVFISSKDATLVQYLIYLFGNLILILPIILIKKIGKEKVYKNWFYSFVLVLVSYILLEIFRGIGAIIFAKLGFSIILQYLLIDSFNLVFSIFIILISRVSNIFIDQKAYLINLNKEKESNQIMESNKH